MLYGQGEYVTKHHAVVLSAGPEDGGLPADYRRTDVEGALAVAAPPQAPDHRGPATIETHTVLFDRGEKVRHGIVVLRTPEGARLAARVEASDTATLATLRGGADVVGRTGRVSPGEGPAPVFRLDA